MASAWSDDSLPNLRIIALGTVGVTAWAVSTSLLVFLYKFILVGDFNGKPDTGACVMCACVLCASSFVFVGPLAYLDLNWLRHERP